MDISTVFLFLFHFHKKFYNLAYLHIDDFEKIAQNVIIENGFNYPVNITIEKTNFPTKNYGDISLPAGIYDALNVKIGTSSGHNWWCVLFPQLCIGTAADSEELEAIDGLARQPEYRLSFALVEWLERLLAAAKEQ